MDRPINTEPTAPNAIINNANNIIKFLKLLIGCNTSFSYIATANVQVVPGIGAIAVNLLFPFSSYSTTPVSPNPKSFHVNPKFFQAPSVSISSYTLT